MLRHSIQAGPMLIVASTMAKMLDMQMVVCAAGPRVAKLDSQLQRIAEQKNISPIAEDTSREDEVPCSRDPDPSFPLSGRSASDSAAQWDFRRREVRRSSRSAQEWVRTSLMEPHADYSRGLQDYHPGKEPDHLLGRSLCSIPYCGAAAEQGGFPCVVQLLTCHAISASTRFLPWVTLNPKPLTFRK